MTTHQPANDPVLHRFRAAVAATYGARLQRVVLFGSRARGDHRPDSDYDIAVFLKDYDSFWTELDPLVDITTDILSDTGAVISAKPFRADSYTAQTLFMGELRREGIDL
jgi:predicted nucleotidyltransferase